MCSREIQAVKAFDLKFKARLSWITGVLKIFALEFNCVGNHFFEEFFSESSFRNHCLVSTFLKILLFGISQLFVFIAIRYF